MLEIRNELLKIRKFYYLFANDVENIMPIKKIIAVFMF